MFPVVTAEAAVVVPVAQPHHPTRWSHLLQSTVKLSDVAVDRQLFIISEKVKSVAQMEKSSMRMHLAMSTFYKQWSESLFLRHRGAFSSCLPRVEISSPVIGQERIKLHDVLHGYRWLVEKSSLVRKSQKVHFVEESRNFINLKIFYKATNTALRWNRHDHNETTLD